MTQGEGPRSERSLRTSGVYHVFGVVDLCPPQAHRVLSPTGFHLTTETGLPQEITKPVYVGSVGSGR